MDTYKELFWFCVKNISYEIHYELSQKDFFRKGFVSNLFTKMRKRFRIDP